MTNDRRFFVVLERTDMRNVTLANGEGAKVLGIDSGELQCFNEKNKEIKFKIKDVLYVPDLTESLLSVKKLTEIGLTVQFKGKQCVIVKDNIVVATANLSSNMYAMRIKHRALAAKGSEHTPRCQHTWHRRFGHRHPEDVQKLQDMELVGIKDAELRSQRSV
jgi:hypothetical protein